MIGQAAPAWAVSELSNDERNGLADARPLQVGEILRFPRGFRLPDFSPERGMATALIEGGTGAHRYVCAFAIEADTEVKFPEYTHWTVLSTERDGELIKISFTHDTWGALRPLEFRCSGAANVNQILMAERISIPVDVPVEHISD